jgi:hypothetical protein
MCKLLLHCLPSTSGESQVENVRMGQDWLVSMQAASISVTSISPSSSSVSNEGSYTFTHYYAFIARTGITCFEPRTFRIHNMIASRSNMRFGKVLATTVGISLWSTVMHYTTWGTFDVTMLRNAHVLKLNRAWKTAASVWTYQMDRMTICTERG